MTCAAVPRPRAHTFVPNPIHAFIAEKKNSSPAFSISRPVVSAAIPSRASLRRSVHSFLSTTMMGFVN
jgi:hypothetical protein